LFSGDLVVHETGKLKVERGQEDGSLVVKTKFTMNIGFDLVDVTSI